MTGSIANADENTQGAWRQNMSPEQQQAMQQKWNSLSPEQQEAMRARSENKRQKWEGMTPGATVCLQGKA